ncbi:MAG: AgmX/PglI C-terminal domain-containing protein [Kofleriaceae bacterium]
MAGGKVPLTFRIFKGDQLVREERLSLSVIKIGKVPSAHLKLDDETVSRTHAIIEVNGPTDVSIIDLGSTKGTFVNGQRVNKAKLQTGDNILVGDTRIELAIGADALAQEDAPTRVGMAAAPETPAPRPTGAMPASTPYQPSVPAFAAPAPPPRAPTSSFAAPAPPTTSSFSVPTPSYGSTAPGAPTTSSFAVPATPSYGSPAPAPASPSSVFATPSPSFGSTTPPPQPSASYPAPSFGSPTPPPARPAAPPVFHSATPGPQPSFGAPPAPAFAPPPPMSAPGYGPSPFAAAPPAQSLYSDIDDLGASRAVEVAAMLGDSVVAVKHCMEPRSGKISSATYATAMAGLFCLFIAVVSFSISVGNAAKNKGRFIHWTEVDKKPAYAFRPEVLSLGYDAAAFGGLTSALFLLTFALVRYRRERKSPFFRIGTAAGVEFPLELPNTPEFPLIAPSGDDFVFNFAQGMEGEMTLEGRSTSLAELAQQGRPSSAAPGAAELSIPPKARIRVRAGKATFLISSVAQPRRSATAMFASLESRVMVYFAGSLAAHLLFWAILRQLPVDETVAGFDIAQAEDPSTRTSSTAQDDPLPPEEEDKPDDGADQSGGTGQAMTLEEGKMGKQDSTRAEGTYKMKDAGIDPQLAKQQALEAVRTSGILGTTALTQGGAFASLTGTGDISSGLEDADIYGGLIGNEAGEMAGGFGYGRGGVGPGGGGQGWGTIGTGRYGTIGHGDGTGTGYGVGGGRGGMRGRTSAVPTVSIGTPSSNGDLDKAIIRRYIKRNLPKIQYCYEKELLAKPSLSGTVKTTFLIMPNGTVASASGAGVDGTVASCVAAVVKAIEFPKPKNGGSVEVNYPFTFRSANGS